MGTCVVNNVQFKECTVNNDGGGIFAQLRETGGILAISNHTSFVQCINTVHGGGGILIFSFGSNSRCIISDNVIFEQCEARMGSAMYLNPHDGASFEVHNVYFKECFSGLQGGTIQYQLDNQNDISSFILDGVQFINCSSQYYGGSLLIVMYSGITTINGSTFSGSQSIVIGGAIMAYIWYGAALVIENTQFESCNSTSSNGGSIYATIDSGSLSINQVRFIGSSCSQPGSGSSRYGWGGAIYISTLILATELSSTNFLLTNLSFLECSASGAGNNLHIRSPNTYNTGIAIAANSLLTIKDLTDLYKNEQYSNDYMGIDESKVNDGNTQISDHQALFLAAQGGFITKEYYIKSPDGNDTNDCSLENSCKTINNILSKSLPDRFVKGLSIVVINLLSETSEQNGINISSETELNNIITVQSNGYQSGGTQYTKQSIQTQYNTYSLFAISNTGRLKLLGLHFDNLKPSSTYPLILISTSTSNDTPQLLIDDCEFKSTISGTNLDHSIILINGGVIKIERTTIENYIFDNGISLINIKSDKDSTVTISQTTFASIAQTGTGNGSVINAELKGASKLTIKEGCSFSSCSSSVNGGAIYAELNFNAALTIDNGIFKDCNCTQPGNGGALYILQQTDSSKIFITESSFTNCQTLPGSSNQYGWGGAIYINISYNPPSLTATNFQLTDLSFTNCNAFGAGNNLHILSPDTHATGQAIKIGNLLTVKDLNDLPYLISDLYISPSYAYDYMGINKSIEFDNPGTNDLDLHNPLFEQLFTSIAPNPSYIDGINGKDIKFCGQQSSMCKTIKYATERNPTPLSGIIPTDSTYSIILTSSTALDTDIQIMSTTLLKGHIMIQSDGYDSVEDYSKQSILTSSFSRSLFT
ncbi:MAG: hypothetical protein EZS28_028772, partial [Streblomastix strix]